MKGNITSKNYKKLVFKAGISGASFCVIDTLNNNVSDIMQIPFTKGTAIEDELWKVFTAHPELKMQYDEITVLHDNSFNTFVPQALFEEEYMGSYLQYNTKVFDTDVFAFDSLDSYAINNVYVPFMNINNYLIDRFGAFEYRHTASILTARLLDISKNIDEKQVFVHLQDKHFEIVVVRNQKLLLYNSFEYSTPEDFLYYLLFTMEQLSLNPEITRVLLLGKTDEDNNCFTLAYNYIRNIELYQPVTLTNKYHIPIQQASEQFILLNA